MRIDEQHEFLGQYIRSAADGQIGIAGFHRQYVWTENDVENYLASVAEQLPIGGFVLWTLSPGQLNDQHLSKGRLGPVEHDDGAESVMLDGQNRLSTILWAARSSAAPTHPNCGYSPQERAVWLSDRTLVADIAEKRMHFVPAKDAVSATRFPLGTILNSVLLSSGRSSDVYQDMAAAGIADSDLNWFLNDVPNFFRHKRMTVTEIRNASPEEALDIFLRICRTGQGVTDDDIATAKDWLTKSSDAR